MYPAYYRVGRGMLVSSKLVSLRHSAHCTLPGELHFASTPERIKEILNISFLEWESNRQPATVNVYRHAPVASTPHFIFYYYFFYFNKNFLQSLRLWLAVKISRITKEHYRTPILRISEYISV